MDCALPGTRPGPRCAETTLSMRAKDTGQMAKGRLGACMSNLLCEDCRSSAHKQACSRVVNPGGDSGHMAESGSAILRASPGTCGDVHTRCFPAGWPGRERHYALKRARSGSDNW